MISHQEMGVSQEEIERLVAAGRIERRRDMRRRNLRVKRVMRFDEIQRHFRLLRIMWERGTLGGGYGYSVKLAFGLWPRLLGYDRTFSILTVLGLRIHYSRSYGGRFA